MLDPNMDHQILIYACHQTSCCETMLDPNMDHQILIYARHQTSCCETMLDPNRDHQILIYAHHPYYPAITVFIFFRFLFILLFQMSVHMRRLEDNGQPVQRVGNQLMIRMLQSGNRRINIEHK